MHMIATRAIYTTPAGQIGTALSVKSLAFLQSITSAMRSEYVGQGFQFLIQLLHGHGKQSWDAFAVLRTLVTRCTDMWSSWAQMGPMQQAWGPALGT